MIIISEVSRYQHQSPFPYLILKFFTFHLQYSGIKYHPATLLNYEVWDVGYGILDKSSDIRYNVKLHSLQSNIGGSDIELSLISLITEIGLTLILTGIEYHIFLTACEPHMCHILMIHLLGPLIFLVK